VQRSQQAKHPFLNQIRELEPLDLVGTSDARHQRQKPLDQLLFCALVARQGRGGELALFARIGFRAGVGYGRQRGRVCPRAQTRTKLIRARLGLSARFAVTSAGLVSWPIHDLHPAGTQAAPAGKKTIRCGSDCVAAQLEASELV